MDKKKLSIKFSTHDGKVISDDIKQNAINNINLWLAPIADELNEAEAIVELFIDKNNIQHLSFSNISKELQEKAITTALPYFPYR